MKHIYTVTGMTCAGCEEKVKSALLKLGHVTGAEVSRETGTATIIMDKHISLSDLQHALDPKYRITAEHHQEAIEQSKSWIATYKPILLIFSYLILITLAIQFNKGAFDLMQWMQHFMSGFFLVFSFFKLLNLQGFAESYAMYDILAKRIRMWPYLYVLIEFSLGMAYLLAFRPFLTNSVAFVVMVISIVGVLQSVLNSRKIQCACLGAIFNLPMSTVTVIEDGLMILMSGIMLLQLAL